MNQRMTFTSATLYDGVNDKQTGMTVVVDGQDIVAVGRDVSPGATDLHYDLGGRTIMPGMTIGHWHGEFVDIGPPYFDRRGGLFLGTEKPPAILALQAAAALRTALYSGILRVIGASCSANNALPAAAYHQQPAGGQVPARSNRFRRATRAGSAPASNRLKSLARI